MTEKRKPIVLTVDEKIGDTRKVVDIITSTLSKDKMLSLLVAPMATGKSTFFIKHLTPTLIKKGSIPIFISPTLSLLDSMENKCKCENVKYIRVDGDVKSVEIKHGSIFITTPESLKKIIAECNENQKNFFMVYDEIHQFIENVNWRRGLKIPIEYYKNELCTGLFGMTATPEPLFNISIDQLFYVKPKRKFKVAEKTEIVENFKMDPDHINSFIKEVRLKNPNAPIVAKINNKEIIKSLKGKFKNSITWYRTNSEDDENNSYFEDMKILREALKGEKLETSNIIFTTSLTDVGSELYFKNNVKPIVINFVDSTASIVAEIQQPGRFREGIKHLYYVGSFKTEEERFIKFPPNQKKLFKKFLDEANNIVETLNNFEGTIKTPFQATGITPFKNEDGNWKLKVDEYEIMQRAFQIQMRYYLQTAKLFREFLKNHITFESDIIGISDYEKLNLKVGNEIKEAKKATAAEKKEVKNKFIEEVKENLNYGLTDEKLEQVLNYKFQPSSIKIRLSTYENLAETWESEELEEVRKNYRKLNKLKDEVKNKFTQIELLQISMSSLKTKEMLKQFKYISYNVLYDKKAKLIENKEMKIVYSIRNYINKTKNKERSVLLSNKFKDELLTELQKEKSLSKLTANNLDKLLNLIYSIGENKPLISSIKTNL